VSGELWCHLGSDVDQKALVGLEGKPLAEHPPLRVQKPYISATPLTQSLSRCGVAARGAVRLRDENIVGDEALQVLSSIGSLHHALNHHHRQRDHLESEQRPLGQWHAAGAQWPAGEPW
jgi:hypothetical protein